MSHKPETLKHAILRVEKIRKQRNEAVAQIQWLQDMHTLHQQVEMLYVVNGYHVTITKDGLPISQDFFGETLTSAISTAMNRYKP